MVLEQVCLILACTILVQRLCHSLDLTVVTKENVTKGIVAKENVDIYTCKC